MPPKHLGLGIGFVRRHNGFGLVDKGNELAPAHPHLLLDRDKGIAPRLAGADHSGAGAGEHAQLLLQIASGAGCLLLASALGLARQASHQLVEHEQRCVR
jgi:hypothetical protein